jgi:geranylgeranyl diphosphate synthase type II
MNSSGDMIEATLLSACQAETEASAPCLEAIRDHLAAGGSRVRARICHDAGIALGMHEADAKRAAAVCELLHNASLVQDDLLDRSTVRRGEPCVWVTHGDAIAICAGDLMLSSAYALLAEISNASALASTLRLVHRCTREVILGQALEGSRNSDQESTKAYYDRLAQGKSASLLSLALELPLLLTGNTNHLTTAQSVARDFAVAYQIADDLADLAQDIQEGTLNLAILLIQHEGMTRPEAVAAAQEIAIAKLDTAEDCAQALPNGCAATLLHHADRLRRSLNVPVMQSALTVESPA